MTTEYDQQLDRVAELLALRAQRKLGVKPSLRVVGSPESLSDVPLEEVCIPALPDETQYQAIDLSPRAVKTRAIVRIANTYGWHAAIVHFLETRGAAYLSDLTEPQLDDLLGRMDGYVDAAETGSSLADCLPAT